MFQVIVRATRMALIENGSASEDVCKRIKGLPKVLIVHGKDRSYMLVPVALVLGGRTGTFRTGIENQHTLAGQMPD
jgi:hypothetical protein